MAAVVLDAVVGAEAVVVVGAAVVAGAAVVVGTEVVVGAAVVVGLERAWDSSAARAAAARDIARSRVSSRCCLCASVQAAARSENERRSTETSGFRRLSAGGSDVASTDAEKYRPSNIGTATEAATSLRRPFRVASRTAFPSSGRAVSAVTDLVRHSTVTQGFAQLQKPPAPEPLQGSASGTVSHRVCVCSRSVETVEER